MDLTAVNESELLGAQADFAQTLCELGTVGHEGDEAVADLGESTNGGVDYLKVTLYKGHPRGEPRTADGFANGHQVTARVLDGFWAVPPRGTQCVVLFPGGDVSAPGAGLALPLSSPKKRKFPNAKEGDYFFHGAGGQFVRARADGGISLFCTDTGTDQGRPLSFSLIPSKGLQIRLPWGTLSFGPEGFHLKHSGGARLDLGAIAGFPAPLDALSSYAKIQAASVSVRGVPSVGTDGGTANTAAAAALASLLAIHETILQMTMTAINALAPGTFTTQQAASAAAASAYADVAPNIGKIV